MAESEHKIRIIPLGGVDEFGKNITVVEYGEDMLVVTAAPSSPRKTMLGVDLVIPDVTYLIKTCERIRGMLLTHGARGPHRGHALCAAAGAHGPLRHQADACAGGPQAQGAPHRGRARLTWCVRAT